MAKSSILRTSLEVLYFSGAAKALRPVFGGRGAIFMLHHVTPAAALHGGFAPNAGLAVTPQFLDAVIDLVRARGFDLVDLDEAAARISAEAAPERPFAVFTLDDGYRDNLVHALPVFRRHRCPFTVYVAPAITDGTCELWWRGLEAAIAGTTRLSAEIGGETVTLDTVSDAEKWQAWQRLYWPVRRLDQHAQRRWIRAFCEAEGIDLDAMCRTAAMGWDELRTLAADPLCTIGAHTINHFAVSCLAEDEARREIVASGEIIAERLGRKPTHFAYPYGDAGSAGARDFRLVAEAGYRTAVTTRKGLAFAGHRDHLTALPRLSLSGDYQKLRYVDVLLTGTAFALFNGFRKLNVA